MIVKTDYKLLEDNKDRVVYQSDSSYMIRKVGTDELYDSAVEFADTKVDYVETEVCVQIEV